MVEWGKVTYYLDGAHTPESMEASALWFLSEVNTKRKSASYKFLAELLCVCTGILQEGKTESAAVQYNWTP